MRSPTSTSTLLTLTLALAITLVRSEELEESKYSDRPAKSLISSHETKQDSVAGPAAAVRFECVDAFCRWRCEGRHNGWWCPPPSYCIYTEDPNINKCVTDNGGIPPKARRKFRRDVAGAI
ncbi:unnamed protein product [Zymoseptoria tritici ST99CH_3D7]|uniref:Uncharacterized protein n=1 Tax=Zymoseptoria tritici (strain ST99CH_3D7) TaxID=1276538 RepID=A0A1X7RLG0_ZYMT9|nr:unnamed protein product [Zymoseptoria tritici ST99CH_3D7]